MERELGIGISGCGWIASVHAAATRTLPHARVVACCASEPGSARSFARRHDVPAPVADHDALCARDDVDVVIVCTPNHLHHRQVLAALAAGKHVIVEKPLALSLEEGEEIVAAARETGLCVAYAEELCFVPKFEHARQLVERGAVGEVRHLKQVEKHDGPHARWFRDPGLAGGGVAMDMACHSIEWARWVLGKPAVSSVWCDMRTWPRREGALPDAGAVEDHVVCHLEFAGGETALLESSWTLLGGMDSRTEIHGTGGVLHADLLQTGSGMRLYSSAGVADEAPAGWSFPDADWSHQNGYPQELAHFLEAITSGSEPGETAVDGLAVLEILLACYHSAGTGRRVALPFRPRGVARPIDLWRAPRPDLPG